MNTNYEKLIEMGGWTLLKDPERLGMKCEHFIAHDACSKGFQLEVDHEKGECSVVHWEYQRCQRCNAVPPEGVMALYFLIKWEAGDAHV